MFLAARRGQQQTVEIRLWDFSGPEVYFSTHQFFLSTATTILVFNLNDPTAENYIEYWIKSLTSKQQYPKVSSSPSPSPTCDLLVKGHLFLPPTCSTAPFTSPT